MSKVLGTIAPAAIAIAAAIFAPGCGGPGEDRRGAVAERRAQSGDQAVRGAAAPDATATDETATDATAPDETATDATATDETATDATAPVVTTTAADAAAAGVTVPGAPPDGSIFETEPVRVYFPIDDGRSLGGETRTVFKTPQPGDRAKQIVAALLEGPQSERSSRAVPEGTQLRQLFVLDDGTAWADFSSELRDGLPGGSTDELLAVYAIVDSIALNVPGITRVGILVDGHPVESLNGHIDLRRALPARRDLIAVAAAAAE